VVKRWLEFGFLVLAAATIFALAVPNEGAVPPSFGHSPSAAARIYVHPLAASPRVSFFFHAPVRADPSLSCRGPFLAGPVAMESVADQRLCGSGLSAGE
jgi:hypothetical protein